VDDDDIESWKRWCRILEKALELAISDGNTGLDVNFYIGKAKMVCAIKYTNDVL
jgi:hypothetical protein